jgi:hypothetical protein
MSTKISRGEYMFGLGQMIGLLLISLLFGAIVQSFGKRRNQTELGNIGLVSCTVVTFLAGFMGIHLIVGLATMTGFIVAINAKK